MANVLDVIDIYPDDDPAQLGPDAEKKLGDIDEELSRVRWLGTKIEQGGIEYQHRRRFDELHTKVRDDARESEKAFYWETFCEHGQLPVQIQGRAPGLLKKLAVTPRASLAEIREITTRLGFVIVPWAYLSEKSYAQEPQAMRVAIDEFSKVDEHMDVYVVCPPMHYSFGKHLDSDDPNKPIFAGKNEQAFMALQLSLPPLRAMQAQVKVLAQNQENLGRGYSELRTVQSQQARAVQDMQESIQTQLGQIQQRIEADIRDATMQLVREAQALAGQDRLSVASKAKLDAVLSALNKDKATLKDIRSAADELASVRFELFEPMMFAIPKGTSLRADVPAYIGPCWGPDFEEILLVAASLQRKGRREDAEKKLAVWSPPTHTVNVYGQRGFREPFPWDARRNW